MLSLTFFENIHLFTLSSSLLRNQKKMEADMFLHFKLHLKAALLYHFEASIINYLCINKQKCMSKSKIENKIIERKYLIENCLIQFFFPPCFMFLLKRFYHKRMI